MGYVVTTLGIFGTISRRYRSELTGEVCVIVVWGPLRWIAPVLATDCHELASSYEAEARAEAEAWMAQREAACAASGGGK